MNFIQSFVLCSSTCVRSVMYVALQISIQLFIQIVGKLVYSCFWIFSPNFFSFDAWRSQGVSTCYSCSYADVHTCAHSLPSSVVNILLKLSANALFKSCCILPFSVLNIPMFSFKFLFMPFLRVIIQFCIWC